MSRITVIICDGCGHVILTEHHTALTVSHQCVGDYKARSIVADLCPSCLDEYMENFSPIKNVSGDGALFAKDVIERLVKKNDQ